jgi:hypothetical protein
VGGSQRVQGRIVDRELALTGLKSHTDEGLLKDAGRLADIPYVSCFKGRLLAASQGILRVYGHQAAQRAM